MDFLFYTVSDIGTTRKTNQDRVYAKKIKTNLGTAFMGIVCDGMGGLACGEVASSTAIRNFSEWFEDEFRYISGESCNAENISAQWERLIESVQMELEEYGVQNKVSVGTTLSALLIVSGIYYIAQIGDSRIYLLRGGALKHVTTDHSYVMELAEKGLMTYDEACVSKQKNVLTRCIGSDERFGADFFCGEALLGDGFVISSDGFHGSVTDDEMSRILSRIFSGGARDFKAEINCAVKEKIRRGEKDNISVICVKLI